jgi:predicted LPLAT superfamily acyltransferase
MRRHISDRIAGELRAEWALRPERLSSFLIQLGAWIALTLGRATSRLLLFFICWYFVVASPEDRRASRQYLGRALGRKARLSDIFRHFHAFAATILDRAYLLKGQFARFDVRVHGEAIVADMAARGESCLLLGAHMGSFEIVRFLGRKAGGFNVNLVMYEENARRLHAVLNAIDPEFAMRIIALGKVDSILQVENALTRGEFVGMLGDRTIEGEGTARCPFLGEPARFPTGPFRIAAILEKPVVLMLGLYCGGNRYEIYFEKLADMRQTDRAQRDRILEQAVRDYVGRLEHYCRLAPYNWFNFHDVWE